MGKRCESVKLRFFCFGHSSFIHLTPNKHESMIFKSVHWKKFSYLIYVFISIKWTENSSSMFRVFLHLLYNTCNLETCCGSNSTRFQSKYLSQNHTSECTRFNYISQVMWYTCIRIWREYLHIKTSEHGKKERSIFQADLWDSQLLILTLWMCYVKYFWKSTAQKVGGMLINCRTKKLEMIFHFQNLYHRHDWNTHWISTENVMYFLLHLALYSWVTRQEISGKCKRVAARFIASQ